MAARTLFELGQVVMTPGVANTFTDAELETALARHWTGDWGTVDDEDRFTNNHAVAHGQRIISAYVHRGHKLWIITEADRSSTTPLLPSEY